MATEVITSFLQITDDDLVIVPGAEVSVYDVGTTTLKSVFSDTALSVGAANPIICNSAGLHDMRYIAVGSYKIVIRRTGAGTTIRTRDNIDGRIPVGTGALAIINGGTGATTAPAAITALGGATAAEVAAIAADVASLSGQLASSEKTHIATGTTAQRPATPAEGDIRRNTDLTTFEGYNGSAWINFAVLPTAQTDPSATDTAEGFIEIATQAEMETGTDVVRAVTPGRVQHHRGVAKAWGKFAGATGTLASGSLNVASVVRDSAGDYTITFTTAFSSADYAVMPSYLESDITSTPVVLYVRTQAAGSFTLHCDDVAGTDADPDQIYFVCFGDQA